MDVHDTTAPNRITKSKYIHPEFDINELQETRSFIDESSVSNISKAGSIIRSDLVTFGWKFSHFLNTESDNRHLFDSEVFGYIVNVMLITYLLFIICLYPYRMSASSGQD